MIITLMEYANYKCRILRCFVLIDLKKKEVQHYDIGDE